MKKKNSTNLRTSQFKRLAESQAIQSSYISITDSDSLSESSIEIGSHAPEIAIVSL